MPELEITLIKENPLEQELTLDSEPISNDAYEDGYKQGYDEGYNEAEKLNYLYYAYSCDYMFYTVEFPENSDIVIKFKKAPTNYNLFMSNAKNTKTVTLISEYNSNNLKFGQAFRNNQSIEILDLTDYNRSFSDVGYCFLGASNIREVKGELDFSNCTNFTAWLNGAYKLEEMRVKPNSIYITFSLEWNDKLSDATVQSFIDGLADLTGSTTQKICLHKTIKNKLTDSQIATVTQKNWTIA